MANNAARAVHASAFNYAHSEAHFTLKSNLAGYAIGGSSEVMVAQTRNTIMKTGE